MEELVLMLVDRINGGKPPIRSVADLCALPAARLLRILESLPDQLLPAVVGMLKESGSGFGTFQKLMGEHEEELKPLVDSFFERYMSIVTEPEDASFNPLQLYLPPELFDDLAMVQSREQFFKRQPIETINEYLSNHFPLTHEFIPGEQDTAWEWFWHEVCKR